MALEVSNTRVTGTVPGSWGMLPDLRSLTLYATALDGPMPATFVGTAVTAILIEGNTGATFCGSGTAESPLSAALPACSAVTGIPQVRVLTTPDADCVRVPQPEWRGWLCKHGVRVPAQQRCAQCSQ